MDAFASACNARAPRLWSLFLAPGIEMFDAPCAPDWMQSVCLVYGLSQRKVLDAFQLALPVRATVEKACADRTLCVLVVPEAILASHWSSTSYPSEHPLAALFKEASYGFGRWGGICCTWAITRRRSWQSSPAPSAVSTFGPGCRRCSTARVL